MIALIFFIVITLFLASAWLALLVVDKNKAKRVKSVVTVAAVDDFRYKARLLMTPNQLEFFQLLVAALPNYYIFPQLELAALLKPGAMDEEKTAAAVAAIAEQRVDYAIYDAQLQLICIVELTQFSHNSAKNSQLDQRLKTANIAVLRYKSQAEFRPSAGTIAADVEQLQQRQQMQRLVN